ncbi:disulfide bond formation protein B [Catenovulum agarivorans DS-2]|uniref:Disulfide bond formation protein B n=1 Tax=Catenovulum agarivorans DS-2 TaxID=1328313 RepID=W7QU93_9ALTE|nr:disulfide bond formation protein DsbB [Catenovulum agarivorans]EWH11413.1 disulfide bond formation protein B [Catenovulum agarivorans DS-2]
MLTQITRVTNLRIFWVLLALSVLALEVAALVFQYGFGFEPCIKCVYQRLALWGVFVALLPACLFPKEKVVKLVSSLASAFFAAWGAKIAIEHVGLQNAPNPLFAFCEVVPDFPQWFAPDIWFPALFEPRGDCSAIDWTFLTLSMPQWMQIIFIGYAVLGTALFILTAVKKFSDIRGS